MPHSPAKSGAADVIHCRVMRALTGDKQWCQASPEAAEPELQSWQELLQPSSVLGMLRALALMERSWKLPGAAARSKAAARQP